MREIGQSKVQRKTPKKNYTYPFIRFPQECADIIGKRVRIFETEYGGQRAYVVMSAEGVTPPVAQLALEERVASLEQRIQKMEREPVDSYSDPSGGQPEGLNFDGPVRVRTGDLRRVRATS
jgi:hypothetical protein